MTDPASWRIYRDEWLVAFVAFPQDGQSAQERAEVHFARHYRGKVLDCDVRFVAGPEAYGSRAVVLELRLPNMRGEFKTRELAQEFADRFFAGEENVIVVGTDSPEDRDLRTYGMTPLPKHEHQLVALYDRIAVEPDAAAGVNGEQE